MKNKKGISAIVATVLIILITVAAVTIIWAAIIPMIQDQIGGSTECFDASAALSVTTDFSCVDHNSTCSDGDSTTEADCDTAGGTWTNSTVSVQVHRGTGNFVLTDVEIIIGAGGTTSSVKAVEDLSKTIPDPNGDRVYEIMYSGTEPVTEAGVAAIVQAGNTVTTCDKSGMVQIPDCA